MRLFFFLILVSFSELSFGQTCTQATLNAPDGDGTPNTYTCTTLEINSPGVNRSADGSAGPVIVTVSGNVTINADIDVSGGNGSLLTVDPTSGPLGGPGATPGGGVSGGEGEPLFSINPEDGIAPPRNGVCNDGGGGGGGFDLAGENGFDCANAPSVSATGGADWGSVFPTTRGGFGGGAGGAHDVLGVFNHGSGGGGGGAIQIISTGGSITVARGVTISARGGNGGDASSIGGAGGGGSGGVVLLDGFLGVTNNGSIDVRGGNPGTSSIGGEGGRGRSGVYRIVNAGVPITGTGLLPGVGAASAPSLKSDITCGTVARKNDQNLFYQMGFGFLIVALMTMISKTLFRFRMRIS